MFSGVFLCIESVSSRTRDVRLFECLIGGAIGGMLDTEGDGELGGTETSFLIVKDIRGVVTQGSLSIPCLQLFWLSLVIACTVPSLIGMKNSLRDPVVLYTLRFRVEPQDIVYMVLPSSIEGSLS